MDDQFEKEKSPYEKAVEKSNTLGFFALTAEDHKAMGSTPDEILKENPGKAAYEVLTIERIEELLDSALDAMHDKRSIETGYAKASSDFFKCSLPFLRSVGRLPKKFEDFDMSSI